jgi:hypothetical protein
MPMVEGKWTIAQEANEAHQAMLRRHRADGQVDAAEADAEMRHFEEEVFPAVFDAFECLAIAAHIMRCGTEGERLARMLNDRRKRMGMRLIPFPAGAPDAA